jgi:hypothetical protein
MMTKEDLELIEERLEYIDQTWVTQDARNEAEAHDKVFVHLLLDVLKRLERLERKTRWLS